MKRMRGGHIQSSIGCNRSVVPFDREAEIEFMADDYSIIDGGDVPTCTQVDNIQWTYNNGQMLAGSAYMYNYVSQVCRIY